MLQFAKIIGVNLSNIIKLAIVSFFSTFLVASTVQDDIKKAKNYEKIGDIKNAMIWYKKAALSSVQSEEKITQQKNEETKIIQYGENDIEGYGDKETDNTISQIIFSTFDMQPYKANYLLPATYDSVTHAGRQNFETKFQFSFKKSIAENLFGLNEKYFVAYTQVSWWQTAEESTPFRESNYSPEAYIMFPYYTQKTAFKAYKVGILHQSNGQDGLESRSWNRLYLSGMFQYNGIFIEPRVWYRFQEDTKTDINQADGDDNPDIAEYLGYGDLKISYPYKGNLFSVLLRNNLDFNGENRGAAQLDWTFPLAGVNDLFGYLQIFSGYGESLIDYNKRSDRIGIGFSLSR